MWILLTTGVIESRMDAVRFFLNIDIYEEKNISGTTAVAKNTQLVLSFIIEVDELFSIVAVYLYIATIFRDR